MYIPAGGLEGLLGAGRGGRGLPGAAPLLPSLLATFTLLPLPSVSSNRAGCDRTGVCPCPDSFIIAGSFAIATEVGGFGVVGESMEAIFFTVSPS